MPVLDRSTLEHSTLADLHAIAARFQVDHYRRLRKADLINTLLEHQTPGSSAAAQQPAAPQTAAPEGGEAGGGRRRHGHRGGRGRGAAHAIEDAAQGRGTRSEERDQNGARGQTADATRSGPSDVARSGRGGRRGGRAGRDAREADSTAANVPSAEHNGHTETTGGHTERDRGHDRAREQDHEPEIIEGVVELLPNGSAFLRIVEHEQSDGDVYISAAQVKRCELINGDKVSGPRRAAHRSERYPSLVRVDTINGAPASELADRTRFDALPAAFPFVAFTLGADDPTLKAIGTLTPFGRGSRVVICGAAWSGKSHTLRLLAKALAAVDDLQVLVALAGVRPEETAEWSDTPPLPGAALSFAASADAQDNAVELVIEQARRLVARGADVAVLIDTLDGLHPLSAQRALASARKVVDGGSLTVIATAAQPLGGETTVISLDARLAAAGRFPALDMRTAGTLRAELLVGETGAKAIARERAKALK